MTEVLFNKVVGYMWIAQFWVLYIQGTLIKNPESGAQIN